MQKFFKMIFALCGSVIFITNVEAAKTCTSSEQAEINSIVSNIRGTYQEMEEDLDPSQYGFYDGGEEDNTADPPKVNYFNVTITNITDKVYATVTNNYNDKTYTFNNGNTVDGMATFEWYNVDKVTTFTINIYSSEKTGCANELQRSITLRTPRFNEYYEYALCSDIPEFNLCQKFVTFDELDSATFRKRVFEYLDSKEEKTIGQQEEKNIWEKTKDFIKNNKYYFIAGGAGLIVITGVVVAVIVKKRRSSEL